MEDERTGITWLASYPKSGNTWLRLLLDAYRRNGLADLNDIRICSSDAGAPIMQAVLPMPLAETNIAMQLLVRPAALVQLACRLSPPVVVKTHFANILPDGGFSHCIPPQFTDKAVYIVRDPRSVVLSCSRFFQLPIDKMVSGMANVEYWIGDNKNHSQTLLSSWSNHARSWIGESNYPVHVVKYEDMLEDTAKELKEVLEFLYEDVEVDDERVARAVEATKIAKMQEAEEKGGFRENSGKGGGFFGAGGGTRWMDELSAMHQRQIEEDHGKVMRLLGYLEEEKSDLRIAK